jgi:hypothetical protein
MSAYEELLGHHLRSTLDLIASTPDSDYLDSTGILETEPRVTAPQRRDHGGGLQRPHIPPSYYYFGAPDSDSADDTNDPTRECFNIDVFFTKKLWGRSPQHFIFFYDKTKVQNVLTSRLTKSI